MYNENQTTEKITVDKRKVDMFMMSNQQFFPASKIMFLREKLYSLDEDKFSMLQAIELKNPTTMLILSVCVGSLGVDRFMLKETGMGVLKLLTGGLCGIMTIIDWFSVSNKTKEKNFNAVMMML